MSKILNKKIKAFSLIELSIVILIIGLLIVGFIGGKKLISLSALVKARSLTASSPVAGIEDLSLWFDATSKKSFEVVQPADGYRIAKWNNINPQLTIKNDATQSGADILKPTYEENSINGLPAVKFDGANTFFSLPDKSFGFGNNSYTFFIVISADDNSNYQNIISSGPYATNNATIIAYGFPPARQFLDSWYGVGNPYTTTQTYEYGQKYILASTYDSNSGRKMHIDGVLSANISVGADTNTSRNAGGTLCEIGARNSALFLNGVIGEIIMFERALSDFERQQVEQYLSKKWAITLD